MKIDDQLRGRRRFAFLLPDLGGGGAERVALRLIADSLAAGHEVDLVLLQARGELLPIVLVGVHTVDLNVRRICSVVAPFRVYLRDRRPDAVHIMMWPLTIAGIIACKLARTKARVVISEHTTLGRQYGHSKAKRMALSLTARLFYPVVDAVLCVSEESASDLSRLSGLDRADITVVYNPVAGPAGSIVVPKSVEKLWGEGMSRILTVGNLNPVKNHAMLIRAFARLASRRPAKLIIVGEGPMRAELERVAAREGLTDRVILPGFALDPWPFYASADLFVLSSDYEGFSLVIVEAMRCGVSVVSTDCPSGPREILRGGEFGALTEVGNEIALSEAMEMMLDNRLDPAILETRAEEMSGQHRSDDFIKLMLGAPGPKIESAVGY